MDPKNTSAVIEIGLLISRLEAEIYEFEVYRPPSWIFLHPVWSHSIPTNLIGLLDPKIVSAVIEIGLLISRLEAEVYRSPSWIFLHPVCSHSIPSSLSGLPDSKNIGVTIGILSISCQEKKKCVFAALKGVFN